ncbi:MAG: hypothetical protein ACLGI3_08425 [Actinomycetes bacterium]
MLPAETLAAVTAAMGELGLIPPSALCPLGEAGHWWRCDAAAACRAMSAAYASAFGPRTPG